MTPTSSPRQAAGYLVKLPGLPAELWAVVLAHDHQHGAGCTPGLRGGRLQVPLWAVPQSILPVGGGEGVSGGEEPHTHLTPSLPHPAPLLGSSQRGGGTHGVRCRGAFTEVCTMGSRS